MTRGSISPVPGLNFDPPTLGKFKIDSDVGIYEPNYEHVTLLLRADGTVGWEEYRPSTGGY